MMKAIRIAICDDDKRLCDSIDDFIAEYIEMSSCNIETEIFYTGENLIEFCESEHEFDLIFLDILLPKMSGKNVGEIIRRKPDNKNLPLVFMSSETWEATEFSKIRPFRVYRKPMYLKDIIECLDAFFEEYTNDNQMFKVTVKKKSTPILVNSILYFESFNRKVKIKSLDKTIDGIEFYSKLDDIQDEPFSKMFLRINQSYLVNSKQIAEHHYEFLIMNNNDELPISKSYRNDVRGKLLKFK